MKHETLQTQDASRSETINLYLREGRRQRSEEVWQWFRTIGNFLSIRRPWRLSLWGIGALILLLFIPIR